SDSAIRQAPTGLGNCYGAHLTGRRTVPVSVADGAASRSQDCARSKVSDLRPVDESAADQSTVARNRSGRSSGGVATSSDAVATANSRAAPALLPRFSAPRNAALKESPAPVVSTGATRGARARATSPFVHSNAPSAPSL